MTDNQVTHDQLNKLEMQVLIFVCVMAALLITLFGFVLYLHFKVQKLGKLLKVLDPMSKYKKMGPSLYVKRPQRDISSISSSFKHFDSRIDNEETLRKNEIGTLDRNFFTKSNFNFENMSSSSESGSKKHDKHFNKGQRSSEAEVMDAITKLDKVLY